MPKFTSGDDDIESVVGGILGESALLYGILAEYASICGVVEDAELYEKRFQDLLFGTTKNGKARKLA